MVGAYSIGLHRGGENEVIRSVQEQSSDEVSSMLSKDDGARAPSALEPRPLDDPLPMAAEETQKPEPQLEWKLKAREGRADKAERAESKEIDAVEETTLGAAAEGVVKEGEDVGLSAKRSNLQPPAAAPRLQMKDALRSYADESAQNAPRQRTFSLNGTTFIVDAPDSVRIDQDSDGRTLLIYTSDGVIRIRLAD
jgi:hypothetical protein